jgi:hypothetical protein
MRASVVLPRSDGAGEFGEDRCEPMPLVDIHAEFIVAATQVLHECVPGADRVRPRCAGNGTWRRAEGAVCRGRGLAVIGGAC